MEVGDEELQALQRRPDHGRGCAAVRPDDLQHLGRVLADRAPRSRRRSARTSRALPKYVVSKTLRDERLGEHHRPPRRPRGGGPRASRTAATASSSSTAAPTSSAGCSSWTSSTSCGSSSSPSLLGSGKRLFRDEAELRQLRLLSTGDHVGGVVLADLRAAGRPAAARRRSLAYTWTDGPGRVVPRRRGRRIASSRRSCSRTSSTSTGRAAALGDREWRRLLDRHDEAGRAEVERWQGRVVKSTRAMGSWPGSTLRRGRSAAASPCAASRGRLGHRDPRRDPHRRDRGPRRRHRRHRRAHRVAGAGQRRVRTGRRDPDRSRPRDRAPTSSSRRSARVALRGVPGEWELFAAKLR